MQCGGVHLGSAAGARVARVEGFDDDRSENTMLTYTLAPLHPNFVLDRTSGVITVSTLGLDYETATSHSLAVSVEDGGSPNLRVSYLLFAWSVCDYSNSILLECNVSSNHCYCNRLQ